MFPGFLPVQSGQGWATYLNKAYADNDELLLFPSVMLFPPILHNHTLLKCSLGAYLRSKTVEAMEKVTV